MTREIGPIGEPVGDENAEVRNFLDELNIPMPPAEVGLDIDQIGRLATRGLVYTGPVSHPGSEGLGIFFRIIPGSPADQYTKLVMEGRSPGDPIRFEREAATEDDDTFRGHQPELFP